MTSKSNQRMLDLLTRVREAGVGDQPPASRIRDPAPRAIHFCSTARLGRKHQWCRSSFWLSVRGKADDENRSSAPRWRKTTPTACEAPLRCVDRPGGQSYRGFCSLPFRGQSKLTAKALLPIEELAKRIVFRNSEQHVCGALFEAVARMEQHGVAADDMPRPILAIALSVRDCNIGFDSPGGLRIEHDVAISVTFVEVQKSYPR